ncbi:MAG: hypothetical protein Q8O85_20690 [Rhodoferax sp.]|uniref:hypothetical protein n=1 Tax=Rhodoferax sp. TaxID=50421 RepID=UPI002732B636|nr:hypothetical protein [Rhodoferax sp.]MDP2681114.1 hypothetical protein [Rhodoferax sp.]
MLTLTIHGEKSAASLYLWELTIQCQIAELAFVRLKEAGRVQVTRDYSSPRPHPKGAIQLLADCAAFLSASGIVAKILFASVDTKASRLEQNPVLALAAKRGAALRGLLQLEDLPSLRTLGVRNAFEHIDERLDRLLNENPSEKFVWLHLSPDEPPAGLVLKRFNPNTLQLSYLDNQLNLEDCHSEILRVREKLNGAYDKVRTHEALLTIGANAG